MGRVVCALIVSLLVIEGVDLSYGDLPLTIRGLTIEDDFPEDNSDRMVSPGERILLLVEIENGSDEGECCQVRGYIDGDSTYASILRRETSFGDLGPEETAETESGFELQILSGAPTDTLLPFKLILLDSVGSLDTLPLPIYLVARLDSFSLPTKWVYPGEGVRMNVYFANGEGNPDAGGIEKVVADIRTRGGELVGEAILYDDGGHHDGAPGDGNFGGIWWTTPNPSDYRVTLKISDPLGRYEGLNKDFFGFTTCEFMREGDILLVNDERSRTPSEEAVDHYRECLDRLGLQYTYWYSWYRGDLDTSSAYQFLEDGILVWCAPQGGRIRSHPSVQRVVGSYLERGGRLLIGGGALAHCISTFGSEEDSLFLATYLHARAVRGFNPEDYREVVRGLNGDPIADGLRVRIIGAQGLSQYYADEIDPVSPALPIFVFEPGGTSSSTAAVRIDNGRYRLVYFTFGLEGIGETRDRERLIERTLRWLKYGQEEVGEELEEASELFLQNSPNPFTFLTRISYELPFPGRVTLNICNLSGRAARLLANEEQNSGLHSLFWDGKDSMNREVATGYYFYRLTYQFRDPETQTEQRWVSTNKMLLLR